MKKSIKVPVAVTLAVMLMVSTYSFTVLAYEPAAPPEPAYIEPLDSPPTAADGDHGEWNLAEDGTGDFFANMYEAANPTKDVMSKLYLRYDCSTNTLYALVLVETGHTIDVDSGLPGEEHFIKIKGSKIVSDGDRPPDDTPPDWQWIGLSVDETTADGWEASASLDPGTYNDFDVHTQVDADQTSAVEYRQIDLEIDCTSLGSIGNFIWDDGPTPDHIQPGNENSGLNGIRVYLYEDEDGDGVIDPEDDLLNTLTTANDPDTNRPGWYLFTNLPAGNYIVKVDDQDVGNLGLTPVAQYVGGDDTNDNNGPRSTPWTEKVNLGAGEDDLTIDFGYSSTPTAVTLSSFAAESSAGGSASWLWLGLAGLTVLAAGSLFWTKRRAG